MGLLSSLDPAVFDNYSRLYAKDYIEYPTKERWTSCAPDFYPNALREMIERENNPPVVLYLHIPYCPQMCMFCVCHFKITRDYGRLQAYMPVLYAELDLIRKIYREAGAKMNVREIHLGGGSPTYLREKEFGELCYRLGEFIDKDALAEFTIEIDPRRVGTDRMHFYAEHGIDRVSFGVQDFDRRVQQAINRVQPPELIENLLVPEIRRKFKSVNFDLIVGLPNQTRRTVLDTVTRVKDIAPNRVALSFMHYNPAVHRHQKVMKQLGTIPDHKERKFLHELAVRLLEEAGYIRSGYEHFARPTDEVAAAVDKQTVQYNSLGATPGRCDYLIGLGVSSYGRVGKGHYVQQTYDHQQYIDAVVAGRFAIYRGCWLNAQDMIRRDIIQTLRSAFKINRRQYEEKYSIAFAGFFQREQRLLDHFVADGMLDCIGDEVRITELGKNFTNVICSAFDRYRRGPKFPDDFFDGPELEL